MDCLFIIIIIIYHICFYCRVNCLFWDVPPFECLPFFLFQELFLGKSNCSILGLCSPHSLNCLSISPMRFAVDIFRRWRWFDRWVFWVEICQPSFRKVLWPVSPQPIVVQPPCSWLWLAGHDTSVSVFWMSVNNHTHNIHVWYICTYVWLICMVDVGLNMGIGLVSTCIRPLMFAWPCVRHLPNDRFP